MEQGYGGPVWHASAAPYRLAVSREVLARAAREALSGVGDATAGEWEEWSGYAFHLRRRLSAEEARTVGEIMDIRDTPEADRRCAAVRSFIPPGFPVDAHREERAS